MTITKQDIENDDKNNKVVNLALYLVGVVTCLFMAYLSGKLGPLDSTGIAHVTAGSVVLYSLIYWSYKGK